MLFCVCSATTKSLSIRRPCASHTTTTTTNVHTKNAELLFMDKICFIISIFLLQFSEVVFSLFAFCVVVTHRLQSSVRQRLKKKKKKRDDIAPLVNRRVWHSVGIKWTVTAAACSQIMSAEEKGAANKNQPNADKLDIIFDKCADLLARCKHFLFAFWN